LKTLDVTLEDAFDLGRKEGLKEAFLEMSKMLKSEDGHRFLKAYVDARLQSILDFENKNPFRQKDNK
jgi:hypothetical protein